VSAFAGLFTPTVGGVVEICGLPVDIGFGILFADELTFSTLDNFFRLVPFMWVKVHFSSKHSCLVMDDGHILG
jgi:hypothetical protein